DRPGRARPARRDRVLPRQARHEAAVRGARPARLLRLRWRLAHAHPAREGIRPPGLGALLRGGGHPGRPPCAGGAGGERREWGRAAPHRGHGELRAVDELLLGSRPEPARAAGRDQEITAAGAREPGRTSLRAMTNRMGRVAALLCLALSSGCYTYSQVEL